MSIKAKAHIALMLSLVLLAGAVIAPACALGASCSYSARHSIQMAVTAQVSGAAHGAPLHQAQSQPAANDSCCGTSSTPITTNRAGSCCDPKAPSRMRLDDDRANFTQPLTVGLPAVEPLAVVAPAEASASASVPLVVPPPKVALDTTVIRI